MRRLADRVVLVAHIGISAIFVLVTVLMFVNIIPLTFDEAGLLIIDGFVMAMVLILAGIYLALTAYLLYSAFAQRNIVKSVLLYSDASNATNATSTVIRKIASDNAKLVEGITVKKLRITTGDKGKLNMRLTVTVRSDDVAYTVDTLRCMLVDSYTRVLALTFDSIDFDIAKVVSNNKADLDKATAQADVLKAGRTVTQEIYQEPIVEQGSISVEVVEPITEDTAEVVIDADAVQKLRDQQRQDYERHNSDNMYGTPERPLTDDISVEISDGEEQSAQDVEQETNEDIDSQQDTVDTVAGDVAEQADDIVQDIKVEISDQHQGKKSKKKK